MYLSKTGWTMPPSRRTRISSDLLAVLCSVEIWKGVRKEEDRGLWIPKTLLESPRERETIWLANKRMREHVDPESEASKQVCVGLTSKLELRVTCWRGSAGTSC